MSINVQYVKELTYKKGWSESEFARELGVHRSQVNRLFNGKIIGGPKLIGSIIKVFPQEPMDKLFKFN